MRRQTLAGLLVLVLFSGSIQAQSGGGELALGREAFAQKDWIAAIEHFSRATGALDPEKDREALAEAYLQLGLSYLTGLDRPAQALPAFVKSAELAGSPASAWLWASMAAEKLGRTEEAAQYKEKAMPRSAVASEPLPPAMIEVEAAEMEPVPAVPEPEIIPAPEPPAPPVAEPQSVPAAAAEPLRPEPEPEAQPDAFQHFFGGKKDAKKAAEPAPPEKKKPEKVDAFDYFFGKKKKAGKTEEKNPEKPAEEATTPPPARR